MTQSWDEGEEVRAALDVGGDRGDGVRHLLLQLFVVMESAHLWDGEVIKPEIGFWQDLRPLVWLNSHAGAKVDGVGERRCGRRHSTRHHSKQHALQHS